jgi:hypothetical protein
MTTKARHKLYVLSGLLSIAIFSAPAPVFAGSAIGNGGDIFSHYVESSRFAMKESIRRLTQNKDDLNQLCESQQNLNPEQKEECRSFITQTMRQILALNERTPIPLILLRDEPLFVEGTDGKTREVDARTQLGSAGDIELNYGRVKLYSPFQMLTIITHEFGHKVFFNGKVIEDNQVTPTFATGRMLLDNAGMAIATYAQKKGIIGSYFKLLDHFSCQIHSVPGANPMGASGFSSRTFSSQQVFGRYETGIGILPGNLDVYLIDSVTSEIHFRALIHEEASCSQEPTSRRWTKLSLVRTYSAVGDQTNKPEEILTEKTIDLWNPICDEKASRFPMELSYGNFKFECFYNGSSGTSSLD